MSVFRPFTEARALLGVSPEDDAAAIKRAYRKLVVAHPPDTDPDGFRRVREAFELLTEPARRVRDLLLHSEPHVDPPPLPEAGELPPHDPLPLAILRLAACQVDAASLMDPAESKEPPKT